VRQIKIREQDCRPGHRTDVGMIRKVDGPFVDILGIVWTRSTVPNTNLVLLCETEFTDGNKPPVTTNHIPLVKWTKCTFDAFVEEGFIDSGWERAVYYINSMETEKSAKRIIQRAVYETEISRLRNLKIEYVSPLAKWDIMSNVYDSEGNLLGD
jgi:hypothetical protein